MSPHIYKTFSIQFLEKFRALKNELIDALLLMENYKTAEEEYRRGLKTLENVEKEKIIKCPPLVDQYSVFLPIVLVISLIS